MFDKYKHQDVGLIKPDKGYLFPDNFRVQAQSVEIGSIPTFKSKDFVLNPNATYLGKKVSRFLAYFCIDVLLDSEETDRSIIIDPEDPASECIFKGDSGATRIYNLIASIWIWLSILLLKGRKVAPLTFQTLLSTPETFYQWHRSQREKLCTSVLEESVSNLRFIADIHLNK